MNKCFKCGAYTEGDNLICERCREEEWEANNDEPDYWGPDEDEDDDSDDPNDSRNI